MPPVSVTMHARKLAFEADPPDDEDADDDAEVDEPVVLDELDAGGRLRAAARGGQGHHGRGGGDPGHVGGAHGSPSRSFR